jgi:hypothetical protein
MPRRTRVRTAVAGAPLHSDTTAELWRLQRDLSTAVCTISVAESRPSITVVVDGHWVVVARAFSHLADATAWSDEYRGDLRRRGWHDASPSRA